MLQEITIILKANTARLFVKINKIRVDSCDVQLQQNYNNLHVISLKLRFFNNVRPIKFSLCYACNMSLNLSVTSKFKRITVR